MSRTFRRDPVAADAFVHIVADQLIAELREQTIEPALVHLVDDGTEHVQIGVKPLDDHHPSELLVGFTAPDHWHALGVVTRGWAYRLAERGTPDRPRARVHVVTVLTRSGEVAHRTHVEGDRSMADALADTGEDVTGEQIDLLRRAIGLPTDPAPCESAVYWAAEWLAGLLATEPDELTTWADITQLHPAAVVLGHPVVDGDFIETASAFGRAIGWSTIRSLVSDDRFAVPEVDSTEASWFDDGSFARFVLSRCPPLDMLRSQAKGHLAPTLADRLEATLDDLGIPRSAWPDIDAAA